jgi:hypothetical protein
MLDRRELLLGYRTAATRRIWFAILSTTANEHFRTLLYLYKTLEK